MKSILSKFEKINYQSYPFPHFIIKDALDEDVYNILNDEYLKIEESFKKKELFSKNNIRMQFNQIDLENMDIRIPYWQKFMEYHTSITFLDELVQIFYEDLKRIYPSLLRDLNINKKEYILRCQPGINTPVSRKTSVRLPHLDRANTIFSGLFYMKSQNDDSSGGDLLLYKTIKKKKFYSKSELSNSNSVKTFNKVKYDKNVFICLLNTEDSVHSVTPRNKTNNTRRLVNFISKTPDERFLFHLDRDTNYLRRIKNKIRDYVFIGR